MVNLSRRRRCARPFPCDSCYIVVSTQRKYHLFLDGGTFHHLLVHNLECHEIHFIRYVGPVPDLCMKVQQPVMGVKTAQQVLDAERLAPDMLDVPFVVLLWTDFEMRYTSFETRCRVPSGKCQGRCWDGSLRFRHG